MSYLHSIVICNFCSFTDADRLVLEEDLKRTHLNAYAPGTHKNHRSQWKSYLAFCLHFDFTPVPATAHVVAMYCQFLSRSLTPQSIRNYLSGVKLLHLIAGFEFPFLQSYEVRLTSKRVFSVRSSIPLIGHPPLHQIFCPSWFLLLTLTTARRLRLCVPFF